MILLYRDLHGMVFDSVKKYKSLHKLWELPITDISDRAVAIGMGLMVLNKTKDPILVCDAFMGREHKKVDFTEFAEKGRDVYYRRFMEDQLYGEGKDNSSHFKDILAEKTRFVWKESAGLTKVAACMVFTSNEVHIQYVENGMGSRLHMTVA